MKLIRRVICKLNVLLIFWDSKVMTNLNHNFSWETTSFHSTSPRLHMGLGEPVCVKHCGNILFIHTAIMFTVSRGQQEYTNNTDIITANNTVLCLEIIRTFVEKKKQK